MKDKGPVKGVGPKRVTQVGLSPVEGHKRIAQVEGPSGGQKLIFVEGEPGRGAGPSGTKSLFWNLFF